MRMLNITFKYLKHSVDMSSISWRLELIYVEGFDLNDFSDDRPKGFIVEFDTEYSKNYRVLAIIFVAKKYVA